jgi:hypothetical protein
MAKERLPYMKFYPKDWLADEVAGCSMAAQGLWLRLLMLMHFSERYGYLQKNGAPIPHEILAVRVGILAVEFAAFFRELTDAGVPSVTPTGIIYSRRMVEDAKKRAESAKYGRSGGNPTLKGGVIPPDKPCLNMDMPSELGSPFPEIPERINSAATREALGNWVRHRRDKGKPFTHKAAEMLLRRMEREEWTEARIVSAVEWSIERGWEGVYEPKTNGAVRPIESRHDRRRREIEEALK